MSETESQIESKTALAGERHPLSMLQRQFIDPSLVVETALTVQTTATVEQVFEAVRQVCRRHGTMRTAIGLDTAIQTVHDPATPGVRCTFVGTLDDEASLVVLAVPADDPIRIDRLPVYRCTVGLARDGRLLLHLASHHTLADRMSMHVIVREIAAILSKAQSLPAAPQFHTHVREQLALATSEATWAPGGRGQRALRHWETVLEGATETKLQGGGEPRVPERSPLRRFVLPISAEVAARAEKLGSELRVSRFHVYWAAYALALARHARTSDVVAMCLTHGRNTAATRDIVGLLAVDIVIRHKFRASRPRDIIASSNTQALEAYRHHTTTLTELGRRSEIVRGFLRSRKQRRLMFQYRPHDIGEGVAWPGGATTRPIAGVDLEAGWVLPEQVLFSIDESYGRTSVEAMYAPGAFSLATIEAFAVELVEACRRVVEAPDEPVEP